MSNPQEFFLEKQQFSKIEKQIDQKFQLDYTQFEKVLDWPNAYLKQNQTPDIAPYRAQKTPLGDEYEY